MDYMDDEVRITDTEGDMRKMAQIQSDFAEWSGMKFKIHKCAYWEREFIRHKGQEVTLENFNLCGEAIPKLEVSEAFKYLEEYKAPTFSMTNKKPTLPRGPNGEKVIIHEGKRVLQRYKAQVAQLDAPRIQKPHYAGKLDFLSQATKPLNMWSKFIFFKLFGENWIGSKTLKSIANQLQNC